MSLILFVCKTTSCAVNFLYLRKKGVSNFNWYLFLAVKEYFVTISLWSNHKHWNILKLQSSSKTKLSVMNRRCAAVILIYFRFFKVADHFITTIVTLFGSFISEGTFIHCFLIINSHEAKITEHEHYASNDVLWTAQNVTTTRSEQNSFWCRSENYSYHISIITFDYLTWSVNFTDDKKVCEDFILRTV